MTLDTRHSGKRWSLPTNDSGRIETWEAVQIAVLMDIRDELQRLNNVLHCPNFTSIPNTLGAIRRNTSKPKKVKRQ